MSTYQDRARLLFDKFYTDRKHEYDKFSRGENSAETFKANSKYLLDQALSELASIVEEEKQLARIDELEQADGQVGTFYYGSPVSDYFNDRIIELKSNERVRNE